MRKVLSRIAGAMILLSFAAVPELLAQENPYTYVRMSLGVPWFLYFVFLAAILIPFAILIIVAWRMYVTGRESIDE